MTIFSRFIIVLHVSFLANILHAQYCYHITDTQGQTHTVRPLQDSDLKSMETFEQATTHSGPIRQMSEISSNFPLFSNRYIHEIFPDQGSTAPDLLQDAWLSIDDATQQISGRFSFSNALLITVHPQYQGRHIARLALREILTQYARPLLGRPFRRLVMPLDETMTERLLRASEMNYDIFRHVASRYISVQKAPFSGFIADVAYDNVASLRTLVAVAEQGLMSVQSLRDEIRFVFPAVVQQPSLLPTVTLLARKDPRDRALIQIWLQQLIQSTLASHAKPAPQTH